MKLGLLVAIAMITLGWGTLASWRRSKYYTDVLQRLGFVPTEVPELRMELARPRSFRSFRFSSNFFRGNFNGHELIFFEFWGNHWFRSLPVVAFRLADSKMPAFCLSTGYLLLFPLLDDYPQKVDIADPHFPLHHNLSCSDKQRVMALFSGEVVDFFNKNKAWSVETNSQWMLIYSKQHLMRLDIAATQNFLEKAIQICQVFTP